MKATILITAATLLAGTAFANAQAPSQPEDNGNNGMSGAATHNPNNSGRADRAQGTLPGATGVQGTPGPKGEAEPPGGRFQDEKNREELGKTPEGKH